MAYQGSLDGLCGPYAIVNAYHQCDIEEDWLGEDIFAIACMAIEGWPQVLWEGTSFGQMIKMLKACQRALQSAYEAANCKYPIKVKYPFRKNAPSSNKEYWKRFDEIFSRDDVICGILGLEFPSQHWISFRKHRGSVLVYDSVPSSKVSSRQTTLEDCYAGAQQPGRFSTSRKEMIVFRRE